MKLAKALLFVCVPLMAIAGFCTHAAAQCNSRVNLFDWKVVGAPANGQWQVQSNGQAVEQLINGQPTFFISPVDYIDVKITGSLLVDTSSWDDDYIGFVLGHQAPLKTYIGPTAVKNVLIDWKKRTQTSGQEGYTLVDVEGEFDFSNDSTYALNYWTHKPSENFQILSTDTGANRGWRNGITYDFVIVYTSKKIEVVMDGDTLFQEEGCFEPGRFGFYNYSQNLVTYSNFSYQLLPDFQVPESICTGTPTQFKLWGACAGDSVAPSIIAEAIWDFGDGNTTTGWAPEHSFAQPGNFPVTLTLRDALGCVDSVVKWVSVAPKTIKADFSAATVCAGLPTRLTDLSNSVSSSIQSWAWEVDSIPGPDDFTTDLEYVFPAPGSYPVQLTVADEQCLDSIVKIVEVLAPPTADFTADPLQVSVQNANIQFTNASQGATQFLWRFGDGNTSDAPDPEHTYEQEGSYPVQLLCWDNSGCADSLAREGYITVQRNLFFPTLFSPNQDGNNDFFRPRGDGITALDLYIFNQWGEVIAHITDPEVGWDGTAKNGVAEQGTYVYSGAVIRLPDQRLPVNGHITLIR